MSLSDDLLQGNNEIVAKSSQHLIFAATISKENPLTVVFDGDSGGDVPVISLDCAAPVEGRRVAVIKVGSEYAIIGGLAIVDSNGVKVFNVKAYGAIGDGAADDAPSIQKAIDACAAAGGGNVWFPKGTYRLISAPIYLKTLVNLLGAGNRNTVTTIVSATQNVFECPAGSVNGIIIRGLRLTSEVGGGHCIYRPGTVTCTGWLVESCVFDQNNNGKTVLYTEHSLENIFRHCNINHTSGATVPTMHFYGTEPKHLNVIESSRFTLSGNYSICFEHLSNGNFAKDNIIRNINFEVCLGGEIKLLSAANTLIESCAGWDGSPKYLKDRLYIGLGAGSDNSHSNKIVGYTRRGGSLDTGIKDIKLINGEVSRTTIELCNGTIDCGNTNGVTLLGVASTLTSPSPTLENTDGAASILLHEPNGSGSLQAEQYYLAGIGGNGYIEFMNEQSSAPAAPAANKARLFIQDIGGKTALRVRFPTGAIQTIATEP